MLFRSWRNVADEDVLKFIRMLTFLPLDQISLMDSWEGSKLNEAKAILAFELTSLVHGEEEALKSKEAANAFFTGKPSSNDLPTTTLTDADFTNNEIDILSLLVKAELVASRSEARRGVEQGGVSVNEDKITDIKTVFTPSSFQEEFLLKRGKKNFRRIVVAK